VTARLRLHTQAPTAAPTPAPTAAVPAAKAPAAGPQAPPPPLVAFAIQPTAGAGKSTNISEPTLAVWASNVCGVHVLLLWIVH